MNRIQFRRMAAGLALTAATAMAVPAHAGDITLALANSTCAVMKQVVAAYPARPAPGFKLICKSSGLLAKGMHGGAIAADIFLSADEEWMTYAVEKGLVAPKQVSTPWSNALVVAVPKHSPIRQLDWEGLASDQVGTILIGDPSTAPFGRHAKEALEAAGLWDRVKHKIQTRKNIEILAESLGAAGPDTVGVLFSTNLSDALRPVFAVKPSLHRPIRYHLAPLKTSAGKPEVMAFLDFLHSKPAQDMFRAAGFDASAP